MSSTPSEPLQRSYGCSFGCGNPYDFILVSVLDSETQFLCVPDFLRLAEDMLEAIVNPGNPNVQAALAEAGTAESVPMTGPGPKRRGKNAPANSEDADLIEAFDSVITVDDLPEAFR